MHNKQGFCIQNVQIEEITAGPPVGENKNHGTRRSPNQPNGSTPRLFSRCRKRSISPAVRSWVARSRYSASSARRTAASRSAAKSAVRRVAEAASKGAGGGTAAFKSRYTRSVPARTPNRVCNRCRTAVPLGLRCGRRSSSMTRRMASSVICWGRANRMFHGMFHPTFRLANSLNQWHFVAEEGADFEMFHELGYESAGTNTVIYRNSESMQGRGAGAQLSSKSTWAR